VPGTPGASTWGSLTGTLSAQTDLQTALNGKAATSHTHAPSEITGTAVVTADARLSDARTPTAHTHPSSQITGLVKADVGLGNVDNTADVNKPISTAEQTALNLKAPIASPTFTGTVTLPAVTLGDGAAVTISATTGTSFGQAGSRIGFFGVTPVVRPTVLTQTYATVNATHLAATSLAAPAGGVGVAAGGWSTAANRDAAITSINAIRTDLTNLKDFVNAVVDRLQALGLLQ
jgi:hypothetical protein